MYKKMRIRDWVAMVVFGLLALGASAFVIWGWVNSSPQVTRHEVSVPMGCLVANSEKVHLSGTAVFIPLPEFLNRFTVGGTIIQTSRDPNEGGYSPILYYIHKDDDNGLTYVARRKFDDNGFRVVSRATVTSDGVVEIRYSRNVGKTVFILSLTGIIVAILTVLCIAFSPLGEKPKSS